MIFLKFLVMVINSRYVNFLFAEWIGETSKNVGYSERKLIKKIILTPINHHMNQKNHMEYLLLVLEPLFTFQTTNRMITDAAIIEQTTAIMIMVVLLDELVSHSSGL